ncbi:MAG: NAD(P)H-dependent oxidoreductase subunit E [Bacteroidota bacterium]|nr:NAD(P)H-dependent oxidoreductase subunit E [Bacteroidota bacterium]
MSKTIQDIIDKYNKDRSRLMDILIDIQEEDGFISNDAINDIAKGLDISFVDVEETVSFYHFFSQKPTGKYTIYLNNSVVANLKGRELIKKIFEEEVGCKFGEVTKDGLIALFDTSCIGMNDQEVAAIINGNIFTRLTTFRVKEIVRDIKAGKSIDEMITEGYGSGKNNHPLVKSMVTNGIRRRGLILDYNYKAFSVLTDILPKSSPTDIISEIKKSHIRGRGGAGFPTGIKWEFCRMADAKDRYVFCNADEGEPGTFKDRVILTEHPGLLFEGMAIAAYSIEAKHGILYLRYEYKYLHKYLEFVLKKMRENKFLGKNISGIEGFDFDIRIQFGGGAYVCGEESALLESAEGKRGEPRDRPPFPVEKGYLEKPTVINNVETLCSVVKVLQKGADYYSALGTKNSTGTKLLSISGDCNYPGVYEIEWGFSVRDILEMVGADIEKTQAVQVGGPSGVLVAPIEFTRTVCYSDLSTGGSFIIFNESRNLIKECVINFTEFFIEESCGSCSTCRILPSLMKSKVEKILEGRGVYQDIKDLEEWGTILKSSRCGLGQTAANPILSSIQNFRHIYEQLVQKGKDYDTGFDLEAALQESSRAVGREAKMN